MSLAARPLQGKSQLMKELQALPKTEFNCVMLCKVVGQ